MKQLLQRIGHLITTPFRWLKKKTDQLAAFFDEEPEDSPLSEVVAKTVEEPRGLIFHLNALRKHLFRSILVLIATTALSFVFIQDLLAWLTRPIGGLDSLQAIEVTEPVGVAMRTALLAGFAVSLPYTTFELWLFAAPGLRRRARLWGLIAIPMATFFFVGGMAFAYYVMMPAALPFLLNFLGISTAVRPASYIRFATGLMFWIGLAFQFPLVIFVLAGMGLIRAKTLASYWRIAVVIIAVVAAAITPTIDPVNMGLVMGPMILLYFLSIGLAYIAQPNRHKSRS